MTQIELTICIRHRRLAGRRVVSTTLQFAITAMLLTGFAADTSAQIVPEYDRYSPLSTRLSPGTAARFARMGGKASPDWLQPIRIDLEDGGDVTVYHNRPVRPFKQKSPAQLGVIVGHSYRLKISNIPEMPGVELYPTIEVIDRLHPPKGRKHDFPVPIHIDRRDIDAAIKGNLVTRVIYLEQPQFAAPFELDVTTRARDINAKVNAIAEADRYGRPMVILRIGGRLPSPQGERASYYGSGGPVAESVPTPTPDPQPAEVAPNEETAQ